MIRVAEGKAEWVDVKTGVYQGDTETDPETAVYTFPKDEWKTDSARVEVAPEGYSDVAQAFADYAGTANQYRYQHGELRQRMNIDCMTPPQLEKLCYAFRELYALNSWPADARSYNNLALIHQNHSTPEKDN